MKNRNKNQQSEDIGDIFGSTAPAAKQAAANDDIFGSFSGQ